MNCIKCGKDNDDGAAVCKYCGEKTEAEAKSVVRQKAAKKKLVIGITAAAVALIALAAFLLLNSSVASVFGNTPMNINNGGDAVENSGWIYYCNSADRRSLYKIRTDGSGKTKLNSDISFSINVIGGWIYYINFSAEGSICKISTDGKDSKILYKGERVSRLYVYGDWIYYVEISQNDPYIYRMRTDGTEKTAFDVKALQLNITDGWIYYTDLSDSKNYKMRLDGSEKTELGESIHVTYLTLTDGWIYYNGSINSKLSKAREDGTELTKLTDDNALGINVADGWIYYSNFPDGYIYKVRTDGTEKTKLNDEFSGRINIAGDWIYYLSREEGDKLYRMKTDGSENQPVD